MPATQLALVTRPGQVLPNGAALGWAVVSRGPGVRLLRRRR